MKRHDEEKLPVDGHEDVEIKKEDYEEYLDTEVEEAEPEKQSIAHVLLIVASTLLLLSTIGVIAWGFADVQKERREVMGELQMQEGKAVVYDASSPKEQVANADTLSYEEASELMEEPVKRFEEHANRTDELSMEFFQNIDQIRTTEWKMDYQSQMKQLRLAYADIEAIANKTESGVFDEYASMLRDLIEIADVRYEAIAEKDAKKFMHAIELSKELEKKTEKMFE